MPLVRGLPRVPQVLAADTRHLGKELRAKMTAGRISVTSSLFQFSDSLSKGVIQEWSGTFPYSKECHRESLCSDILDRETSAHCSTFLGYQ